MSGVRRPSAILFDFFGTLVTYQPARRRLEYPSTYARATRLGYSGTHDQFVVDWDAASAELEAATATTLVEFSMTDAAGAFAERCGLDLGPADAAELGTSFVREWRQHVVTVPGVAAMVQRLARDFRLAVVSNTHDPLMVPSMLERMGVERCFGAVVLSVAHGRCKPHPSIYEAALSALDASAPAAWFVGDSFEHDYQAPVDLGMRSLLISGQPTGAVAPEDQLRVVTELEAVLEETL